MAAARQKEIKVSMTEEATTSFTRSECGAYRVVPEAMKVKKGSPRPAFFPSIDAPSAECMSPSLHSQWNRVPKSLPGRRCRIHFSRAGGRDESPCLKPGLVNSSPESG